MWIDSLHEGTCFGNGRPKKGEENRLSRRVPVKKLCQNKMFGSPIRIYPRSTTRASRGPYNTKAGLV
jgi:hypothetical protein